MADPTKTGVEAADEAAKKIMDGGNAGPSGATGPGQTGPAQTGAAQTGAAETGAAQTGPAQSGPTGATGPSGPPEKYEIKLPEGSLLDASEIERTVTLAKEQGLSNKTAQALLDHQSKLLNSYAERQKKMYQEETGKWSEFSKADPEIGGDAFEKNVELAKRVVTRFGTPEFMKGLNETGFGNHPEMVRFVTRIGKAMDDDQLVLPGSKSPAAEKEMADVFYGSPPNSNDKKE